MSAEHARWWATGAVPPALEAAFDAAGWARSRSGSPVIVRPCDDWQAGLDALRDQGERERGRTVLIGEDPPQDIGPRLRAAGGLAWMAPPWPAWMFPLLAATRERSRNERPLHRIHELATVEQLAGTTREEVLTSLAACARDVLRAHVEVWLRRDGKAPFELATAT
ncbi:MAG TPA: hypothetical protein PKA64_17885, partial [Myxococcota bacterium]|nr:hypothetical protein [Myxococcota bacterium]